MTKHGLCDWLHVAMLDEVIYKMHSGMTSCYVKLGSLVLKKFIKKWLLCALYIMCCKHTAGTLGESKSTEVKSLTVAWAYM